MVYGIVQCLRKYGSLRPHGARGGFRPPSANMEKPMRPAIFIYSLALRPGLKRFQEESEGEQAEGFAHMGGIYVGFMGVAGNTNTSRGIYTLCHELDDTSIVGNPAKTIIHDSIHDSNPETNDGRECFHALAGSFTGKVKTRGSGRVGSGRAGRVGSSNPAQT